MSFLNKKIKFKMSKGGSYQWWRVLTFIMFGVMAGSLLLSGIVVYNYTFRTLEDAHTIVLLNTDAVVNTVNMDNYKKASGFISVKTESFSVPNPIRNMFVYGFIAATTTSTTNTAKIQ